MSLVAQVKAEREKEAQLKKAREQEANRKKARWTEEEKIAEDNFSILIDELKSLNFNVYEVNRNVYVVRKNDRILAKISYCFETSDIKYADDVDAVRETYIAYSITDPNVPARFSGTTSSDFKYFETYLAKVIAQINI